MRHVDDGGEVERTGELRRDADRVGRGRRSVLAQRGVERLGGDEFLSKVRGHARDAGTDRRRNHRVRQLGHNQGFERRDQLMDALGRQIQFEELDRNQPLAVRVISAEHRSQRSSANLMQHPKWPECVWRRCAGGFRVQRRTPVRKAPKFNTVDSFRAALTQ